MPNSRDHKPIVKASGGVAGPTELDRLREKIEIQHRHLETIGAALDRLLPRMPVVTVGPRLPARQRPELQPIAPLGSEGWWPASDWPEEPLTPPAGFASMSIAGTRSSVTAVIVFGLDATATANVVRMISARQRRALNFKPVFLTDLADFRSFRVAGYAFEYFPGSVYGRQPHLMRTARAATRMRLLQRKWSFDATIDLTQPMLGTASAETPAEDPSALSVEGGVDGPPASSRKATTPRSLDKRVQRIRASGLFDEDWYLSQHPEVAKNGIDPIRHYLTEGAARGFDPSPMFKTAYYARQMIGHEE